MFNNRNDPVDPSPAPLGTNCILHLGRNYGCENGLGKDLLKRAALASSHAELSVALQAVKDDLGDEVYDALMANKYRYLFMYKIEALGSAETTYGGSVSNEAEQENARRKRLRALDIYKSVMETIYKMEKDHSSSWAAAQGAFLAGKKISDHATKRVINLAEETFKYWKVKNISGIQWPRNGQGHYKIQVTLCLIKNQHLTQTVCINLDPTLQWWHQRICVLRHFGVIQWGIPCKYSSFVLVYLPSLLRDFYQTSNTVAVNRADINDFTKDTAVSVYNPLFYSDLFHVSSMCEAFQIASPLLSNFVPLPTDKTLLIPGQGVIVRQKNRLLPGQVSKERKKEHQAKALAVVQQRELASEIAAAVPHDVDDDGDGAQGSADAEVTHLLNLRSSRHHETGKFVLVLLSIYKRSSSQI